MAAQVHAEMLSENELGRLAYDTYVQSVGGVAFNGDKLPPFEGLSVKISVAWVAAARAVACAVRNEQHG
jgi:hypothetical protein